MKKLTSSIIGGIAGAVALTIINELTRKLDKAAAPVDVAADESIETVAAELPETDAVFVNAMAIDFICNAFYYSIIGSAKRKQLPLIGTAAGLAVGISNITITEPLIVNDAPPLRVDNVNLLKIARYTVGGLVAGAIMKAFRD